MTKNNLILLPCLLLILLNFTMLSLSKESGVLENIVFSKGEKTLEIKIILSPYTYHREFKLFNPYRICIDIFNIKSIQSPPLIQVDSLGIGAIRASMYKSNIARVVIDLTEEFPPYKSESFEQGLRIVFWPEEEPPEEEPQVIEEIIQIEDAICDIKVTPAKANINDSISVDMSGSQHAKSMEVEVFDSKGTKITMNELTPDSPKLETKFDKPGEYTFKGKAFNIEGKPSENPCEAKTYINFPPVSMLESQPPKGNVGRPLTFDASGSTDSDGEVVEVNFTIADEMGNLVDRFVDNEKPFSWEKVFRKKGVYTVTVVATDDFGAVSEPFQVEVAAKQKNLFFLFDAGALAARGDGTYVGYAAGRIGLLYKILPGTLDIILSGGGAYSPNDAPWKPFYSVNLLLNFHLGPVFIGAGGVYTTNDKETIRSQYAEAIANVGFELFDNSRISASIFLEAMGPVVDLSFQDHHKMMLGFRLLF